jgi:hypothetical protein
VRVIVIHTWGESNRCAGASLCGGVTDLRRGTAILVARAGLRSQYVRRVVGKQDIGNGERASIQMAQDGSRFARARRPFDENPMS